MAKAESVIVKSTIGMLVQSLKHLEKDVYIGAVQYREEDRVDKPRYSHAYWEKEPVKISNPWYVPRFLKKEKFRFEQELRLAAHFSQSSTPFDQGANLVVGETGIISFIEEVRMNPKAPELFADTIRDLHAEHGFNGILIKRSQL